jgi:hypothetical protein
MHASAKRGRLWHYVSSLVFGVAILAIAQVWFFLFAFFAGLPHLEKRSVTADLIGATFLTAFMLLTLSPLWTEGFIALVAWLYPRK